MADAKGLKALLEELDKGGTKTEEKVVGRNLASVSRTRVEWLWEGRIPAAKLTVVDGNPGVGKTTAAVDLSVRLASGSSMPLETADRKREPTHVVFQTVEDDLGDTIKPRALAALEAIVPGLGSRGRAEVLGRIHSMVIKSGDFEREPSFPGDIDKLETYIAKWKATFAVVDPLMGYLDDHVNTHADHQIRRVLSALAAMCARQGCALVVLRHPRKSPAGKAIHSGGGSIGIIGAARSALLAAEDPDEAGHYVLASVKSNLGARPRSIRYEVASNDKYGAGYINWLGFSDHVADDLIAVPPGHAAPEIERAGEWLSARLAKGRVRAKTLLAEAEAAGFSKRTLDRAKEEIGVDSEKDGTRWFWLLPSGGGSDA